MSRDGDPHPPSTPIPIHYVLNFRPHYCIMSADPTSVTIKAILQHALKMGMRGSGAQDTSGLRLRWITDKRGVSTPGDRRTRPEDIDRWYKAMGHRLTSTDIDTDAALRAKLQDITATGGGLPEVVQLYVVGPPPSYLSLELNNVEEGRRRYMRYHEVPQYFPEFGAYARYQDSSLYARTMRIQDEDDSVLTQMAPLYEPAFAHAANALRSLRGVKLDSEKREEGEACSTKVPVDDGKDIVDETSVDACLFVSRLRDALGNLTAEHTEGDKLHAGALGTLLRQLFDDPTLKVAVKSYRVDGDQQIELGIEGWCPTAYGVPALYIIGKDRLLLSSATEGAPEAEVLGGMLVYRKTMVEHKYDPVYKGVCHPCLVVRITGTTIQLYAAYFSDQIYRTYICEFALDGTLFQASDEDVLKFQVIRSTAWMLRESYAIVHTGDLLESGSHRHLLPNPSTAMSAPLPFHLVLLDSIAIRTWSNIFTGELKFRPRPARTDDRADEPGPEQEQEQKPLPVHVKSVKMYGIAAHRLLAEHKGVDGEPRPLAPQLYWAGEVAPGLMMIVMESLSRDARTLWSYQQPPDPDPDPEEARYLKWTPKVAPAEPKPVSWDELEDVRTAIALLHAHGFVHGDIRPNNVMLQRPVGTSDSESDDGVGVDADSAPALPVGAARAYVIDFDWAGREGEARYGELNPDVEWPRPVAELNGQLIMKDHDTYMLERLIEPPNLEGQHKEKNEDKRRHSWDSEVESRKRRRDD